MFQKIEQLADISVLRGCWVVGSADFALMLRWMADPAVALLAGGLVALLLCSVLSVCAALMPRLNYGSTPVWSLLRISERPSPIMAQRVIGRCMRLSCLKFALHSATAAAGLLVTSLAISIIALPG